MLAGGLRGATIVDSLDTLYIMGLTEDYKEAKEWIRTSLDLDLVRKCLHINNYPVHFSKMRNCKCPGYTVAAPHRITYTHCFIFFLCIVIIIMAHFWQVVRRHFENVERKPIKKKKPIMSVKEVQTKTINSETSDHMIIIKINKQVMGHRFVCGFCLLFQIYALYNSIDYTNLIKGYI